MFEKIIYFYLDCGDDDENMTEFADMDLNLMPQIIYRLGCYPTILCQKGVSYRFLSLLPLASATNPL